MGYPKFQSAARIVASLTTGTAESPPRRALRFQSAARIVASLTARRVPVPRPISDVSIRRADRCLTDVAHEARHGTMPTVSIRRADRCLTDLARARFGLWLSMRFNPPRGSLPH